MDAKWETGDTAAVRTDEPLTLAFLRQLVESTKTWPDSAPILVRVGEYSLPAAVHLQSSVSIERKDKGFNVAGTGGHTITFSPAGDDE